MSLALYIFFFVAFALLDERPTTWRRAIGRGVLAMALAWAFAGPFEVFA